jgi:hypothetical protein
MPHLIHQTIIRFPEIQLATRDAHKLRGYFGNLFREQSPLLHNHLESGETAYRYPLVQYKVLHGIPTLVGLNEGADLLIALFMKIEMLEIDGYSYPILQKNIESYQTPIGLSDDLHPYHFSTLWMALNQKNYSLFLQGDTAQQLQQLKAVLVGNILSFYKAMGYQATGKVLVNLKLIGQRETHFKNNAMLAFEADFVTNNLIPGLVGLGKAVARGFGTIGTD